MYTGINAMQQPWLRDYARTFHGLFASDKSICNLIITTFALIITQVRSKNKREVKIVFTAAIFYFIRKNYFLL